MAQQIHPTAFRLAIEKTWYSQIETKNKGYYIQHDLFLRELISGYFLAQGWITSEIIISHQAMPTQGTEKEETKKDRVKVKFMVYGLNEKVKSKILASDKDSQTKSAATLKKASEKKSSGLDRPFKVSLVYLVEYLGYVLKNRSPELDYVFDVRETQSYCDNAKILADWIDIQVSREPRQYRNVLQQVIREMKRIQDAKMK